MTRGNLRGLFDTRCVLRLGLLLAVLPIGSQSAVAQEQEVLDNGLVRLTLSRSTGLFAASGVSGAVLQLSEAGPSFQKDGQVISVRQATKIETRQEAFEDQIGQGQRLIIQYSFRQGIPSFRYELNLYTGKPWVSATAYLPRGDYELGDFSVLRGNLRVPDAFKTRLYVASGTAGGDSGVWELGMRRWDSKVLSVYYEPSIREALGLSFYSFYRASTSVVSQYLGADEIGVDAAAHYYDYRPQDADLRTESLLINFGRDPLRMLDDWASNVVKVVHPKFNHDTRTGWNNAWFAYGNQTSESNLLRQAKLIRDSALFEYGVTIADTGEWQLQRNGPGDEGDALGFGEDQEDRQLYPHGVKWLSDQIHALGLATLFGANYAYAASESSLVKKNVPWIIREDRSRLGFGFPIDFTDPGAQTWLHNLAQRGEEFKTGCWWTDFDGGPTRGKLHDSTKIMGFEDVREGLKVQRDALDPGIMIQKACCGQYFAYIGLIDRMRVGDDSHPLGDFAGLKAQARQLAANFMLHQRFWINDADAVFVGGRNFVYNYGPGPIGPDPSILDEVRMRLQNQVTTGSFPTIGENLEDLDPARIHLLTLVLPSYGQAARPLDLFINTTPEVYDLKVKKDWETWHVLLLQNWNSWDKSYAINFFDLGLDGHTTYLVFRFWDQAFLGQFRSEATLAVGARKGETYAIREVPQHPWVLSTDMHLTQGGVELRDVKYDLSAEELSGVAERHAGADGHVIVYVPAGYSVRSAIGQYREDSQPSGAKIVYLQLRFSEKTTPWSLTFAHEKHS